MVLDYWESEFGSGNPPNAAVTADGVVVAVTLGDPRIGMSARSDKERSTPTQAITFTATPLPGQVRHPRHYQSADCLPGRRPNVGE